MADLILSVEDVTREFGERIRTRALAGVSLTLRKAEFVALIGPSGSGKSSLLNIIGLLDRPTSGRVVLDGVDTSGVNGRTLTELRARKLGFIFQFHHLLPAFSALENVMLPAWADEGFPSRATRDSALQLLAAVGLPERVQVFMTDHEPGLHRVLTTNDVHVGPADGGQRHPHDGFAITSVRLFGLFDSEAINPSEYVGFHVGPRGWIQRRSNQRATRVDRIERLPCGACQQDLRSSL